MGRINRLRRGPKRYRRRHFQVRSSVGRTALAAPPTKSRTVPGIEAAKPVEWRVHDELVLPDRDAFDNVPRDFALTPIVELRGSGVSVPCESPEIDIDSARK